MQFNIYCGASVHELSLAAVRSTGTDSLVFWWPAAPLSQLSSRTQMLTLPWEHMGRLTHTLIHSVFNLVVVHINWEESPLVVSSSVVKFHCFTLGSFIKNFLLFFDQNHLWLHTHTHTYVRTVLFVLYQTVGKKDKRESGEKQKRLQMRNVNPAGLTGSAFVPLLLYSPWLQSEAAQVTLLQAAEALAEIVLWWVMVELTQKHTNVCVSVTISVLTTTQTLCLSEVLIPLSCVGTDHLSLSGKLSRRQNFLFFPQQGCWEMVLRSLMEEHTGERGFLGLWEWCSGRGAGTEDAARGPTTTRH